MQTKHRSVARKVRDDPPQGSAIVAIVSAAMSTVPDWQNNPLLSPGQLHRNMQVLHATPTMATPKPEPHPLREEEGGTMQRSSTIIHMLFRSTTRCMILLFLIHNHHLWGRKRRWVVGCFHRWCRQCLSSLLLSLLILWRSQALWAWLWGRLLPYWILSLCNWHKTHLLHQHLMFQAVKAGRFLQKIWSIVST